MGKEQRNQRTGMLISFVTMDIIVCLHKLEERQFSHDNEFKDEIKL